MKRLVLCGILACGWASIGAAQMPDLRVTGAWALAGYREQKDLLDFSGNGPAVGLDATWRRWGLLARVSRLEFRPTEGDSPAQKFKMTETELALRFRPRPSLPVDLEVGVIRRTPTPSDAAQSLRAFRVGAAAHFVLAQAATVDTRAAWLAGTKYSGGGTTSAAMTLGLRAAFRPVARYPWASLIADYAFTRFDRRTDIPVPLQGSVVALGLEVRYRP